MIELNWLQFAVIAALGLLCAVLAFLYLLSLKEKGR